ncbi:carboxypeptidase-like regulatory domain-containing protein [Marivirga atlantica]|jgi:hypothetical protein|uniref:Carboxypeptidase-like regulatory domain-containing protein n=1 Tax=Marivirga atlantica TaxID=1548457 RepID=A0A937A7Q5_9BACT|nr:carboxypeptidase-like regulatory domain-containing protein [Marivirga atlantica]MBL0765277.1 carboxypeptidase-like regulatory domain-containing protein [Marivirga atlantica]
MRTSFFLPLIVAMWLCPFVTYGQSSNYLTIQGKVFDSVKELPVPFAHIQLNNSTLGVVANKEGEFILKYPANSRADSITISSVGYQSVRMPITDKLLAIELEPDILYLKIVEVKGNKESIFETVSRVLDTYTEQIGDRTYQLDAYYYSYRVKDNSIDTAVSEAVTTMLFENGYSKRRKMKAAVLQKRNYSDRLSSLPWPSHSFAMADIRPNIRLLHRKISRDFKVDSVQSDGRLTTVYYHIDNPTINKIIYENTKSCSGAIQFYESGYRLKSHRIKYSIETDGDGLKDVLLEMNYDEVKGVNLPIFCIMDYTGISEGDPFHGKEITKVNEIKFEDFDFPAHPIIEIQDARYDSTFWVHYNRIK